jgi:hypothetical protein
MAKSGTVKDTTWGSLGGNHAMHGWSGTGTQTPDRTSQEGSGAKRGIAPHAGGRDPLSSQGQKNKDHAGTQTPGQSASMKSGGDSKFAEGGKTSMFGNRGSLPAKPGCSCP